MGFDWISLAQCASSIVDNRGRTCPVGNVGIPLIATNCLRAETLYPTYETERFVSPETYSSWFRGHPIAGDIIFVTKGSPGRVCLAPDPVDFCIAQDMVAIRADERLVYQRYLFAVLRSATTRHAIENLQVGTMIPHFKKGDFDKLMLPIPCRSAQEAIGDVHFELCERIDNLRQTNTTFETIAQALFKSWFVDFDAVHAKAEGREPEGIDAATAALFPSEFEESELGLIPKGWHAGIVDEVSHLNATSWSSKRHPDTVTYVDLSGVHENRIGAVNELPFSEAPSRARRSLQDGDTIVGTVRPGNRAFAYIHRPATNLTGSTGFAVLSPKDETWTPFVYLAATRNDSIERLANLADGGAYPAVRPDVVSATPATIPPSEIIAAFSVITSPILCKIGENRDAEAALVELRDTLLPRLISGKLRLPDAEREIEAVV